MFLLWVSTALSKDKRKQKLYLWGDGRNTWVTTRSWGQGELGVKVRYRKKCSDLTWPSNSITAHVASDDTQQDPGVVLIKLPSRKPPKITVLAILFHTEWCSHTAAISTTHFLIFWELNLIFIPFALDFMCKTKKTTKLKKTHNLPPAKTAEKCAGGNCSLHATAKTAQASC